MLDNTITIAVDELNNGTLVDMILSRYEESNGRSVYITPAHSLVTPDTISFYRTPPKKVGNFNGVAKSAIKISSAQLVAGVDSTTTLTQPAIIDVSFSVPVGTTTANLKELRQRVVALLDSDSLMLQLSERLEI